MATRLRPLGAAGIPTRKVMMMVAAAAACFSLLVFVTEQSGELPLPPAWAVIYTNGGGTGGVGMPHAHGLSRHGRGMVAGGAAAWRVGSRRQQQQHDPWPDRFPGADLRFVAAMGTDLRHVGIVHASRGGWRRGMRTLVAVEARPNETVTEDGQHLEEWVQYADNPRSLVEDNPGAVRSAISPWLAHKAFGGRYEWLLWGDDDTMWFTPALQKMVAGLDPQMPYLITDHTWFCPPKGPYAHPAPMAPRCLPCGYNVSAEGVPPEPYAPPIGCPCTTQLLCEHEHRQGYPFNSFLRAQQALGPNRADPPLWLFDDNCTQFSFKELPDVIMGIHGGAGAVLSVGLLNKVPMDEMERCLRTANRTSGSDSLISRCLWEFGVAPTDPGHRFFRRPGSFDPDLEMTDKVVRQLRKQTCDAPCQMEIDNRVTLHTRSARKPDLAVAAEKLRMVNKAFYDDYLIRRAGIDVNDNMVGALDGGVNDKSAGMSEA